MEFLSETNEDSSKMIFKGDFIHNLWAFGWCILIWCKKWKGDMILCIFKGGYGIYEVLMKGEDWDKYNITYKVRADG